jgi:hypothetical protein
MDSLKPPPKVTCLFYHSTRMQLLKRIVATQGFAYLVRHLLPCILDGHATVATGACLCLCLCVCVCVAVWVC